MGDAEQLGTEPALTLVASAGDDLFCRYELTDERDVTGELLVNPLYRVERSGESSILTLTFPTPEYEAEFGIRRNKEDSIPGGAKQRLIERTRVSRVSSMQRRNLEYGTGTGTVIGCPRPGRGPRVY